MFGTQFYPTPASLASIMLQYLTKHPTHYRRVLDPNGGRGDLLEHFRECGDTRFNKPILSAIEIDPDLQNVLLGKGIQLLDSDWLAFNGFDQFDLILMNPPFANGDRHLLKAIEVMAEGEIVCILNAETLRNPHSNTRKDLANRLSQLNATISFHRDAFMEADRKTTVEVAVVHVVMDESANRGSSDDMLAGLASAEELDIPDNGSNSNEIELHNSLEALVHSYNLKREAAINAIGAVSDPYVPDFLRLSISSNSYFKSSSRKDLVNGMLLKLREQYWLDALQLDRVRMYLTERGIKEFTKRIEEWASMDFTMDNLLRFMQNLSNGYNDLIADTIVSVFDSMSRLHSFDKDLHNKNVHYYNGWKTNNAFKVGMKVVQPINFFDNIFGRFAVSRHSNGAFQRLEDIEKVLAYFSKIQPTESLYDTIERALKEGETRRIKCTYFELSIFKKGTCHLVFNDQEAIHRFNLYVGANKGWLPQHYGRDSYEDLSKEERDIVDSFEGKKSYMAQRGGYRALIGGQTQPSVEEGQQSLALQLIA